MGYGIFNALLARNPSAAVVPWVLLVPPVAIGSAWLLLDERPTPAELLGGALLVLGVLVALRSGRPDGSTARAMRFQDPVRDGATRELVHD